MIREREREIREDGGVDCEPISSDMSSSVQIVRDLFQVGSFLFGVIVLYRTRQEDDFANQKLCKKLESIGKKLDAVEQKLLDSDSKLDKIRAVAGKSACHRFPFKKNY